MENIPEYNGFPTRIPLHVAKDLLDNKMDAKDLCRNRLYAGLKKIEVKTKPFRYVIVFSENSRCNLTAAEIMLEIGETFVKCVEIIDSQIINDEIKKIIEKRLLHKIIDAFIGAEKD